MKNLLQKIEELDMSFGYSVLLLCFAIFLRTFLENFINIYNSGMSTGFVDTFLHYPAWFLSVFIGISIILSIFTGKNISKTFKLVSVGSFIIILPTVIDIIFYQHKIGYAYITGSWSEIFHHYLTLLIQTKSFGIGIKTEIIIVLFSIFYYVYSESKSIIKAILATWLSYTLIFAMLILPSVVYFIVSIFTKMPELSLISISNYFSPSDFLNQIFMTRSYISDAILGGVRFGMNQNMFSTVIAQTSLLIGLVFSTVGAFLYFGKDRFIKIIKNFRYLRIAHYFILIVLGILFSKKYIESRSTFNLYDCLSLISLFFSIFFAWLVAVWENDEADRQIDSLSNQERPLVSGGFSEIEWKNIKKTFFVFSIIFALLTGYTSLIMVIVFMIIYHIYSIPPLRLKKYPIISSMLIGSNACIAFLLGFSFFVGNQPFDIIPVRVLIGIFIFYSCVENIKNLKDVEGDRSEGILTIPVIFGDTKGKFITWFLVLIGTFVIPFMIFTDNNIFLLAPVLGAASYYFIVRKDYKEKPLFLFYLISFSILILLNFK